MMAILLKCVCCPRSSGSKVSGLQVEAMRQEKQALHDAHVAEMELQSKHYADLAVKLRKLQAHADAQQQELLAALVEH